MPNRKMLVEIGSPRGGFGAETKAPTVVEIALDLTNPGLVYQLTINGVPVKFTFPASETAEADEKSRLGTVQGVFAKGGAFC